MDWNQSTMYEQRVRFILEVQQRTFSFAESCRRYGISRTAGYTWWKRFLVEGVEGLSAHSTASGLASHGFRHRTILTRPGCNPRRDVDGSALDQRRSIRWSSTTSPAHPSTPIHTSSRPIRALLNAWPPASPSNPGGRPQIDVFGHGPHVVPTRQRALV